MLGPATAKAGRAGEEQPETTHLLGVRSMISTGQNRTDNRTFDYHEKAAGQQQSDQIPQDTQREKAAIDDALHSIPASSSLKHHWAQFADAISVSVDFTTWA